MQQCWEQPLSHVHGPEPSRRTTPARCRAFAHRASRHLHTVPINGGPCMHCSTPLCELDECMAEHACRRSRSTSSLQTLRWCRLRPIDASSGTAYLCCGKPCNPEAPDASSPIHASGTAAPHCRLTCCELVRCGISVSIRVEPHLHHTTQQTKRAARQHAHQRHMGVQPCWPKP